MKRNTLIFFALLAVGIGFLLFLKEPHEDSQQGLSEEESNGAPDLAKADQETSPVASTVMSQPSLSNTDEEMEALAAKEIERRKQDIERGLDEWRTPIQFFGKVVDENDKPVADAKVNISCNDLSADGTSYYQTESNNQGLFSIDGIRGKHLNVKVGKPGYYTSQRDNHTFTYAGENENFVPNRSNPMVFHLRKVGEIQTLFTMAGGSSVPKDGSQIGLSLTDARVVRPDQAELVVQCWTADEGKKRGEKFDWRCQLSVPGGGIVETTGEFPFLAPEVGYQPSVSIQMPISLGPEWHDKAALNCFVKLENGNYGRIRFEMVPYGEHFFLIESYLNLSGSRLLEGDPNTRRERLKK